MGQVLNTTSSPMNGGGGVDGRSAEDRALIKSLGRGGGDMRSESDRALVREVGRRQALRGLAKYPGNPTGVRVPRIRSMSSVARVAADAAGVSVPVEAQIALAMLQGDIVGLSEILTAAGTLRTSANGPLSLTSGTLVRTCTVDQVTAYDGHGFLTNPGCATLRAPPWDLATSMRLYNQDTRGTLEELRTNRVPADGRPIMYRYTRDETLGDTKAKVRQAMASGKTVTLLQNLPPVHMLPPGKFTPGGGSSPGAGASGSWGDAPVPELKKKPHRKIDQLPSSRDIHRPKYERDAVERTLTATNMGGVTIGPPVDTKHRFVINKDVKPKWKKNLARIIALYHTGTELVDLVDSLAKAIPGEPCKKLPGVMKLFCVLSNVGDIEVKSAIVNIIANEIEDQIVGRMAGALGYVRSQGGPNTTQMTNYIRFLGGLRP